MDQIELVLYSCPLGHHRVKMIPGALPSVSSAREVCFGGRAGIKDERYDSEHGTLRERRRHLRIAAQYLDRAWLR
jgi:hypothetical protein